MACCDILERDAQWTGDRVLASLIRFASIVHTASQSIPGHGAQSPEQCRLIWLGLETEADSMRNNLDPILGTEGKNPPPHSSRLRLLL